MIRLLFPWWGVKVTWALALLIGGIFLVVAFVPGRDSVGAPSDWRAFCETSRQDRSLGARLRSETSLELCDGRQLTLRRLESASASRECAWLPHASTRTTPLIATDRRAGRWNLGPAVEISASGGRLRRGHKWGPDSLCTVDEAR